MKHLSEYAFENLSTYNKKRLQSSIKKITDDNADYVLPKIEQICKESDLIGDNFKQYFINKGLDNKSFEDKKEEIGIRISSYFAAAEKSKILINIVNNNDINKNTGVISYDELRNNSNIYDICEKYGFRDVAEKIAKITNVKSHNANVGQFEILLKFMLTENAAKHDHGDVSIIYKNATYGLEVKGGDKKDTSARINGQSHKSSESMSNYFIKEFDLKQNNNNILFGGAKSNEKLADILNYNNVNDIKKIITEIVKAFAYQYNLIKNKEKETLIKEIVNAVIDYNKNNKIFELKDNKITIKRLTQLFGAIQLICYSIQCGWNAIFVVNQTNGYYVIVDSLKSYKGNNYIDYVLSKAEFADFEGNSSAEGRRCASRIFPK